MNDRLRRALPALGVGAFVAALAGHLAAPHRLLAVRDVERFHLPLRAAFVRLAAHGPPEWNPWVGGGQPLLSDPSYAAFYPPTWLAFALGPALALDLSVLFHLALTALGAFLLLRRLGGRPAVAAFGAIAWSGNGALLSLVHAVTLFTGAAWIPWALLATETAVTAGERAQARRAGLGLAAVFALMLLNGEPVTVLAGGLAAGCWALGRADERRASAAARGLVQVAAAALLATAFAAAQLVPALARFGESGRAGGGVARDVVLSWSLPPERLAELAVPRLFGAPERMADGLYFGWGFHDRDFPFVVAIDPGQAALLLGLAALLVWPIPGHRGLVAMASLGLVLALGRHTPVYGFLYEHVPPFASLRYPEKFFLLVALALVLAAALGLEHLLRRRESGYRGIADLPIALAGVLLAGLAALGTLLLVAPERISDFIAAHSGLPPTTADLERVLAFCRQEAVASVALAGLTLLLFIAARGRRTAGATLAAGLTFVAAADLLWHHRSLLPTAPAALTLAPPELAHELPAETRVLWSSSDFDSSLDVIPRRRAGAAASLEIARLDPWTGLLYGYGYALSKDYAITYTAPARRALAAAHELWRLQDRERFYRLLGAWATDKTVVKKSVARLAAEIAAGEPLPLPAEIGPSPFALPRVRTVGAARAFPSADEALAGALADGLPLAVSEYVSGAPWPGERRFDGDARVRVGRDDGDLMELELDGRGPTLVVVATTWDRFWTASAEAVELPVLETAAGYLAVPVPAGVRRLELRFRDPWVRVGGAISAAAVLLLAVVTGVRRRARTLCPQGAPPSPPTAAASS